MRSLNFRDNVLWAVAYKLGLDPAVEFLKDQATAIASYINAWVRRLWDAADWPEWTTIAAFAPVNHLVLYTQPDGTEIGRVLKVYLLDPLATRGAARFDTPFKLKSDGVHVGYEHGPTVWIKFISPAPRFTSEEWNTNTKYAYGALVYSPVSGECYRSLINNNIGNDPSFVDPGALKRTALNTGITQPLIPDDPGIAARSKIMRVFVGIAKPNRPPDPVNENASFYVEVRDSSGAVLGFALHDVSSPPETLAAIVSDLASTLGAALGAGWTVTADTTALTIDVENDSDFQIGSLTSWTSEIGIASRLKAAQIQSFVPSVPPTQGQPLIVTLVLAQSQVIPGSTYQVNFTQATATHTAQYVAAASDTMQQVILGIVNAMQAKAATDDFFSGVLATVDNSVTNLTMTLGEDAAFEAVMIPTPLPTWAMVPFPAALVDQVVDGVYADCLKEEGQHDRAQGEQQQSIADTDVRRSAFTSPQYDPLSDQQKPKSRYAVK